MNKVLTILFIILFCPQVSLGANETSYLHLVDSCEKKNKKMGELAWKQCASKHQFENLLNSYKGGATFIKENNKVKYFRIKISNENYNFIITQIKDIVIDIPGLTWSLNFNFSPLSQCAIKVIPFWGFFMNSEKVTVGFRVGRYG